jgi:hypothetical protein
LERADSGFGLLFPQTLTGADHKLAEEQSEFYAKEGLNVIRVFNKNSCKALPFCLRFGCFLQICRF